MLIAETRTHTAWPQQFLYDH